MENHIWSFWSGWNDYTKHTHRPHIVTGNRSKFQHLCHFTGLSCNGELDHTYLTLSARKRCPIFISCANPALALLKVKLGSLTGDTAFSILTQFPLNLFTSPGSISERAYTRRSKDDQRVTFWNCVWWQNRKCKTISRRFRKRTGTLMAAERLNGCRVFW